MHGIHSIRLYLPSHSSWWRLLLIALPHLPRTPASYHFAVFLIPPISIWSRLSLTLQFHTLPSLWPLALFVLPPPWSLRSSNRWWSLFRGYYGPISLCASLRLWPKSVITAPGSHRRFELCRQCIRFLSHVGGPGDHSLSGLYPSACSVRVTLPGVKDSSRYISRSNWDTQTAPPRKGGDPSRSSLKIAYLNYISVWMSHWS